MRSGAQNWSVDVFFSVINDFQTTKFSFGFFEFFWKNNRIFSSIFVTLMKKSIFIEMLEKKSEFLFCSNIIYNTKNHIYSPIWSCWTCFTKFVGSIETSKMLLIQETENSALRKKSKIAWQTSQNTFWS